MKAVESVVEAEAELDDAVSGSANPAGFRRAAEDALRDIASGLRTHPRYGRTPARRCSLHPLPYSIIYTETADAIRVIAVPHNRRRRGYWKGRLGRP